MANGNGFLGLKPGGLSDIGKALTSLGAGLALSDQRGLSPFAGLALGFNQASQTLSESQRQRSIEEFRQAQQGRLEAATAAEEADRQRRQGLTEAIGGMDNLPPSVRSIAEFAPEAIAGQLVQQSFAQAKPPTAAIQEAIARAGGNPRVPLVEQPPEVQTRARAALEPREPRPRAPQLRNVFFPDTNSVEVVNANDPAALEQIRSRGGQIVSTAVQATSLEDAVGGLGPTPGEQTEAAGQARESAVGIADLASTLDELEAAGPGATGVRGLAAEKIGGLLGQLDSGLERNFSEFVAGASPEDVQNVRTRARRTVAQSLAEITGEESGRFTEAERAIAETAARTLDETASFSQIKAATETLLELKLVSNDRAMLEAGADLPALDPTTPDGAEAVNRLGRRLLDLGMSEDAAVRVLERIRRQRQELRRTIGE